MTEENNVTIYDSNTQILDPFSTIAGFEAAQRAGKALMSSNFIPEQYKNNLGDVLVAMNMSKRLNIEPLMILQNLQVIKGRPSFSSAFLIAMVNRSGILEGRLKFKYDGEGESRSCYAIGIEKDSGEALEGTKITIQMARDKDWYGRSGSSWPSMPDQMLMYRAAAFWVRMYAADLVLGLHTSDELEDSPASEIEVTETVDSSDIIDDIVASDVLPPEDTESEIADAHEADISDGGTIVSTDMSEDEQVNIPAFLDPEVEKLAADVEELDNQAKPPANEKELDAHIYPVFKDGEWYDAENTAFDKELHAWNREESKPSMLKDGTFRKRVKREPLQSNEREEAAPENLGDPTKQFSALCIGYAKSIKTCFDASQLTRLRPENYPDFQKLTVAEQRHIINLVEMQDKAIMLADD